MPPDPPRTNAPTGATPSLVLADDLTIVDIGAELARRHGATREALLGRHVGVLLPGSPRDASSRPSARHLQLLDGAPDAMVVVGETGLIELVNLQTERMFGYSRDELLGQPLALLIPERFRQAHVGHEARFFGHPSSRSMGSGISLFGRRKDGTELPIEVSLSPLRSEGSVTVSAAIRDITERRHLEAAAKTMAGRLASAVESIQEAFALFDENDELVLCNSVYRSLFGELVTGPLVGMPYHELLDRWVDDIDFPSDAERRAFRDGRLAKRREEPTSSFDIRMRDGRRLRVIDRRTAEGGIVKTIWDLTEDERRAEELREARTAADAGSAAKSEFLASMSHELRTPLNAILGFAQLLQRDRKEPPTPRHRERIDQILKGGEHLLRLIDDILDLARIEAGGISISTEPVGLADVLAELRESLEPIAARQGIRIDVEALPAELPMVVADRTRLLQILMNLGSNAIKYNRPSGEVALRVSRPTPDRVRVVVRDNGFGIPTEKQSKLFQPFQRAGQETGPIEGTGIGLVITRRLAHLMRGDVGFHSVEGEGSEFWVDVPIDEAASRGASPRPLVEARVDRGSSGRRDVVVYVEDNPANVAFMRDLVSSFEDIELVSVPTAELGIEITRARLPKAVIMDINLPGMSGIDALRALRSMPETKDIPVIALTAAASERDKQRGIETGFHRYLTKPVRVDEFLATLEGILALHDVT